MKNWLSEKIEQGGELLAAFLFVIILCFASWTIGFVFTQSAQANTKTYKIAKSYIGLREGTKKANRAMGLNTRRVPWCGAFVDKVVTRSGGQSPAHPLRAYNWSKAGKKVSINKLRKGDVLIIRTKRGHHVTVFSHKAKGRYCGIGGNQSNQVKLTCYRRVVAARRY